jgi:hypothetical protein
MFIQSFINTRIINKNGKKKKKVFIIFFLNADTGGGSGSCFFCTIKIADIYFIYLKAKSRLIN